MSDSEPKVCPRHNVVHSDFGCPNDAGPKGEPIIPLKEPEAAKSLREAAQRERINHPQHYGGDGSGGSRAASSGSNSPRSNRVWWLGHNATILPLVALPPSRRGIR